MYCIDLVMWLNRVLQYSLCSLVALPKQVVLCSVFFNDSRNDASAQGDPEPKYNLAVNVGHVLCP